MSSLALSLWSSWFCMDTDFCVKGPSCGDDLEFRFHCVGVHVAVWFFHCVISNCVVSSLNLPRDGLVSLHS